MVLVGVIEIDQMIISFQNRLESLKRDDLSERREHEGKIVRAHANGNGQNIAASCDASTPFSICDKYKSMFFFFLFVLPNVIRAIIRYGIAWNNEIDASSKD